MVTYQPHESHTQRRYVTHAYSIDEALASANAYLFSEAGAYEIVSIAMQG